MSDEQTNGSETNVRRAFRAKLSPGPKEEIIVLAADAVRAVELIGEKFDWKNIELSRIDEAQLIEDPTKDEEKYVQQCNRLRNSNVVREDKIEQLNATLLLCQRAAVGEQTKFQKGDLANSNALRAIVDRVDEYGEVNRSNIELKRTLNQADREIDKLRKEGKGLTEERDCLKKDLKEIGQVAVELRQTIESFKSITLKPAPPGPVPTGPPVETFPTVEQPFPDDAGVVRPLMPEQIGTVPSDFGTADATELPGPGKPAEATGTGDAEKGDENNYMSPEMRQAGFGRLTDPDFARPTERDEAVRQGGENG